MKIAPFWTKADTEARSRSGKPMTVTARGWSYKSMQEALAIARESAIRAAAAIGSAQPTRRYPYGDRPLPEPILREIRAADSTELAAIITRNAYGALVLNTRNLMFIDIDRKEPAQSPGVIAGLKALFRKKAPGEAESTAAPPAVTEIRNVAERRNLAARVYRTAAGYRVIVTSASFEASSPETEQVLRDFGADPLYIRLCRAQESFRARLSPKPWRCNLNQLPVGFPFITDKEKATYQAWVDKYESATTNLGTCEFVSIVGSGAVLPELQPLIAVHDEQTRAHRGLPLA